LRRQNRTKNRNSVMRWGHRYCHSSPNRTRRSGTEMIFLVIFCPLTVNQRLCAKVY